MGVGRALRTGSSQSPLPCPPLSAANCAQASSPLRTPWAQPALSPRPHWEVQRRAGGGGLCVALGPARQGHATAVLPRVLGAVEEPLGRKPLPVPHAPGTFQLGPGQRGLHSGPDPNATPREGWDQDPACPCTPLSGSQAPGGRGVVSLVPWGPLWGFCPEQEEGRRAELWVTAASRSFAGTWRTAKRQRGMEANNPPPPPSSASGGSGTF